MTKANQALPSLAALARVVLEDAKAQRAWGKKCQFALLGLGVLAVVVQAAPGLAGAQPTPAWLPATTRAVAYSSAILALLLQGLRWWIHRLAAERHAVGNALKRRAMLIDSLGPTTEHLDIRLLRELAGAQAQDKAKQAPLAKSYYASSREPGLSRLRENLQESAFFSHCLARKAAASSFTKFGFMTFGVLLSMFAVALLAPRELGIVVANCVLAFVSFLVSADYLGQAMSWLAAATGIERIERRLQSVPESDMEAHMAAFADYEAATALTPTVPTSVYERERARLDKLWRTRTGQ